MREVRPDVITLDVMMPRMNGWSVLMALKSEPGLEDIPVVMVTMVSDLYRALRAILKRCKGNAALEE